MDAACDSWVSCLAVTGSDVYAVGRTQMWYQSGIHELGEYYPPAIELFAAYWENGIITDPKVRQTSMGSAEKSQYNFVAVSGSDIFIAGFIETGSCWMVEWGYKKNWAWTTLMTETQPWIGEAGVTLLLLYKNDVYAATSDQLGYWKNATWIELVPLYPTKPSCVNALVVQ
jgi:hypothetical protein